MLWAQTVKLASYADSATAKANPWVPWELRVLRRQRDGESETAGADDQARELRVLRRQRDGESKTVGASS